MSTVSETIPQQPPATEDAPAAAEPDVPTTIIEPRSGWRLIDFKELHDYRDLFLFLTWRHIKVQYAQSALGIDWAVIQPLFSMIVFTIVFGRLAGVSSDGAPYAVFSFVALVPWTYFSNAVTQGTNSLVTNTNMLTAPFKHLDDLLIGCRRAHHADSPVHFRGRKPGTVNH